MIPQTIIMGQIGPINTYTQAQRVRTLKDKAHINSISN